MRLFQKQLGQVGLVMIPSPLQAFFRILRMGVQALFFLVAAMGLAHAQTVPAHADYQRAIYDPIHFKPAIDKATNAQCLACHAEVLEPSVRNESIAGVKASQAKAWYQQVSTYQGEQDTFHRRHMSTAYAKQVMNLQCTTCHQGNDPRDEAPGTSASNQNHRLTLRKMASAEKTCLMCHGTMNYEIMGLPGPWPQSKATFQNNCLLCHAAIRTNRHNVNYLNAAEIEKAGSKNADVCYGCHGARPWYRISFPFARNKWEGMALMCPTGPRTAPPHPRPAFLATPICKAPPNEPGHTHPRVGNFYG
jgi:nitrate/TMAO reductase-like tetraheme cytochrome c subunit